MTYLRFFYRSLVFVSYLILQCGASLTAAPLPRATPESTGVSSAAIESFLGHLETTVDSPHSFMLVRRGQVIAEGWWSPHAPDAQHVFFSLSKSFTSTAVGLAIAEGKLDLNDRVIDHFPTQSPPTPSQNLADMRIRDLLAMNTGHLQEDLSKFSWAPADPNQTLVEAFLELPVAHKPGTHFLYNTPATYMLSAIVQNVTGQGLLDYLTPRLFDPLDIQRPHWDESRDGIALGGFGMRATTEDIAKLGQLYLQHGEWNGQRLIPADYVAAATTKQTSNGSNPDSDWDQGYGYQFWRNKSSGFRGDGLFGQFCIVLPEHDTVIAMTSGTLDMGGVMNQIWQHLLPALGPLPIPESQSAANALSERLNGLQMALPRGVKHSSVSESKPDQRFTLPTNKVRFESVALSFGTDDATLTIEQAGNQHTLDVGYLRWNQFETGAFNFIDGIPMPNPTQRAGGSGAWIDDQTFLARICLPETPYVFDLQFVFEDDGSVAFTPSLNVNRGESYLTVIGLAD